MSLADVETRSEGRWSSSAIGAYERGFRNLSVPRLRALAEFYAVPMSVLLGEPSLESATPQRGKLVLDLETLRRVAHGDPVMRFVESIVVARGDYNGRILSLRHDDLRALCALVGDDIPGGITQLRDWGVLIEGPDLPGLGARAEDEVDIRD
jgi:transcriptional regulator with XRE-family HTH domain